MCDFVGLAEIEVTLLHWSLRVAMTEHLLNFKKIDYACGTRCDVHYSSKHSKLGFEMKTTCILISITL